MLTAFTSCRSPSILSVAVRRSQKRLALVITSSPALARAVCDYLRESDCDLNVVWLPSVASACRRLEGMHADMVVVDESVARSADAVNALHAADPATDVRLLAGDTAES